MSGPPGGFLDDMYPNPYEVPQGLGGPRVPDADDLGGGERQDLGTGADAPDRRIQPNAGMDNTRNIIAAQREALGPQARLWVEFPGGTPAVIDVRAMSRAVTSGSFTLAPQSTGVLRISWDPGVLIPVTLRPRVSLSSAFGAAPYATPVVGNANAVDVHTGDLAGSSADLDFILDIF